MTWNRTNCRSPQCRAAIVWTISENGKRLCLDAHPLTHEEAAAIGFDHVYRIDPLTERAIPVHAAELIPPSEDLHRSHWRTCLDVERFAGR